MEEKEITVNVKKYNEKDGAFWKSYKLSVDKYTQMTEVLRRIKSEQDPSLAYRASCHMAVCGSCSMKINGVPSLACRTIALQATDDKNEINLESMDYYPGVRDLITDIDVFYDKMYKVMPRLVADNSVLSGENEQRMTPEDQTEVWKFEECIYCGLCVSACPSVKEDEQFLGPAAHAKGFRFVDDERDTKKQERLDLLMDSAYRCTSCYMCYEVCPQDVQPVIAIKKTKNYLDEYKGNTAITVAARKHDDAIENLISSTGKIKESTLFLKSFGFGEAMRDAVDMLKAGKFKYAFEKDSKVKNMDEIKKLMGEKK
ncbi:succinate dehydrogenase/fumarate reductase iron-sulfur subunit [Ferroplasma acidiphilum]|jgi:succinate dehydrogenase / fumarate reductase iron-sulfur subunit|uniref:succinate dehydrogenase n=1 Tax=Ferroplasma acidiphilum TaxID=74969 RepID=A0A1V0N395_9ARCH|nr:succinate dehydrogenase/fumarate reductase iron-sulfur subunit [Ferroplasma acidiphilum]ARD84622.1 succinate dehydrogenase iron-sulfur subunit [Ferroplasma acidiphilum]MCL4348849.1 succinate dehydrogenase/fumarate reductase iron-sulfur subunit [Candidatus Thermoplasmatota archaeon]NOL59450.1 succinate dehydrogenase/fumarate reductase iron-sulfur subunit [Ferroplasma acidiphilum]WMT53574.1 MAG: succinate dehydrogenase/fumarate reductase iron-sulfur subunit [Ferroplasma acidiphilum]